MENMSDDDPWSQDFLANNSLGAGAFKLTSWDRGATMTMERYDGYHLGWDDQAIDKVRFIVTHEEATVKALAASGELSMSSDAQANETYDSIGKMDGYRIISYPTATNFYLKLNHQVSPTDDVDIRKAIAYGTDYDTIAQHCCRVNHWRGQCLPYSPVLMLMIWNYPNSIWKKQGSMSRKALMLVVDHRC